MNSKENVVYFGFGTNKDIDMMRHIIGRDDVRGVPGRLIGYDLCIQRSNQFRTTIPPNSVAPISPRDLIRRAWGNDFRMYVSRPNPVGLTYGTIWFISDAELQLVRNWEMVDFGVQDDAYGFALGDDGQLYPIITQSFIRPEPVDVESVVTGADYAPYIHDRDAMLAHADFIRQEFLDGNK